MHPAHDLTIEEVEGLPLFPSQTSPIADGHYVVRCEEPGETTSTSDQIEHEIWFQTPPLASTTISKIHDLQLFAESRDQGQADDPLAGNWTWFELAILESETSKVPRKKDGIELIWLSHQNRFESEEYGWDKGIAFGAEHDLVRLLEEGNVIAVRLCSRFPGWWISARKGYLSIGIGKELEHKPVEYKTVLTEIKTIHQVITEVNLQNNAAFHPRLSKQLFSAENFTLTNSRPLRVLSLDGGGVRGLSSLHLLQAVFTAAKITKDPWQVFDMIGGTSTGGLIAIMLGRLKMSIKECIDNYNEVMVKVFPKVVSGAWNAGGGSRYEASKLEKAIREVVKKQLGNEEALLFDSSDNPCKIFVMAVKAKAGNNRGPVFLRSYKNPNEMSELPNIKVWEAARAASAAPAYFDPIFVGGVKLVDGGLGANNPLGWLWTELLNVFGPSRPANCFLSLGTGIAPNIGVENPSLFNMPSVIEAFASVATNSELIHILFRTLINAYAPTPNSTKYWRMNVGVPIPGTVDSHGNVVQLDNYQEIGGLDDVKKLEDLIAKTAQWVKDHPKDIQGCTTALTAHL
ncbi:uncharacterized protein PAC_06926 [Phialocephala subalpina]|uniref:PNPLA domain-containing protein n=1 Tax=Phialocephala subalpina TaxID=576137 RepID=A0A1L7WW85_9HELO|nr:uncharacterized protein PAC_06926 [Phialocephala subalpina]